MRKYLVEQLKEKDNQIQQLLEQNKNNQILLKQTQDRMMLLEDNSIYKKSIDEKRSLFSWFKKKTNKD